MDQTEALVKTIVEGLQEKKGKNIVTVDLTQLSGSICQYMIICEGSTPTQVSALSDSAWDFAHRKAGEKPLSIDGAQFLYTYFYRNFASSIIWKIFGQMPKWLRLQTSTNDRSYIV